MKKPFKYALFAVILLIVIVNIFKIVSPEIKTDVVEHGEMEMSYPLEAVVIRNETVVTADTNGVLESMVSEGEMVRKDKHIASIYSEEIDETIKKKIIHINERINEIENAKENAGENFSDDYRVQTSINQKVVELIEASQNKDVSEIVAINNEIGLLNDQKNALSGDEGKTEEILKSLYDEKARYEGKMGKAKHNLISPVSGIYSTHIDGFEKLVTEESAESMVPEDLENLLKTKVSEEDIKKSKIVCKIIDSFEWSVAVVVTQEELSNIKLGDTVYLRNHNSSGDAVATVRYISTPKNGKYVLTATSDVSCDWAMSSRIVNIDLVKKKYSGLRVPISAVRVKNDTTGVYTVVDGIVRFKKVNILYKNNKYAIVEENNVTTNGLLLYDEVIVSASRSLKDGMRIN